ncbi:MAG: ribokinase [Clostridia bacterium]|nr:ribokinase [Clostridia bacterium]
MQRKIRVLTVSSANMDFVMNVSKVPSAGETLSDPGGYSFIPGGKGANAAVAFRRLGGDSVFCASLGSDANGAALLDIYKSEGIDTRFIRTDPKSPTGLAAIMVEPGGANRIIVFPGSNASLDAKFVESALVQCKPDALFLQFEIPAGTVLAAASAAAARNIPVFVDAGPATPDFPLEKLPPLEVFSPNETETETYTGIDPKNPDLCLKAVMELSKRVRAKYYVLKLGGRGCYICDGKYYYCLPPYDMPVVDTTAAGDCFTAGLTLEYLRSGDMVRAGKYANIVGSLSVSVKGAMPSIPTAAAVGRFAAENGIF